MYVCSGLGSYVPIYIFYDCNLVNSFRGRIQSKFVQYALQSVAGNNIILITLLRIRRNRIISLLWLYFRGHLILYFIYR